MRTASERLSLLYQARGRSQSRIADINDEHLPRLVEHMSAAEGQRLTNYYKAQAYPRVYPDPIDPEPVYRRVRDADPIEDEFGALLDAIWQRHRMDYARVCAALENESKGWQEQAAFTGSRNGAPAHEEELVRLLRERASLSNSFLEELWRTLPPNSVPEQEQVAAQWRTKIAEYAAKLKPTVDGIDPR
jgi:hypothetical protein